MEDTVQCTPQPVRSPFLNDISQCRASMRRLRKKIYKYTATHRDTHRENRRPQVPSPDLFLLLKHRNLPAFVIEQLTKKRTFDLSNIKSVNVSQRASLEEICRRTIDQENEIRDLLTQHKNRMSAHTPHLQLDHPTKTHTLAPDQPASSNVVGAGDPDGEGQDNALRVSEFSLNEDPMDYRLPLGILFESALEEHEWFQF